MKTRTCRGSRPTSTPGQTGRPGWTSSHGTLLSLIFFVYNNKMAGMLTSLALQLEAQSLNSIVAGFSFASAIAWMDVVRWIISQVVLVSKNGGQYYVLSALFTTLLAIVVYMVIKAVAVNVKINDPQQPVYAVTGR
ncbi:hypothetical protein [Yellowstone lake phycodnavirus 3]|uniref:hypothetical protein n=1 Tax=Yellowstone lake phycodnavirus 3 TaxID=1586715 RepID=UPI0006EBE0C6|nr:hypothetical protein AR677_gp162 [Yellowstone lake phycodnavirus 3]BAT22661.1 hypothetical protein [Yellowstone lake phycodnavirus 3]